MVFSVLICPLAVKLCNFIASKLTFLATKSKSTFGSVILPESFTLPFISAFKFGTNPCKFGALICALKSDLSPK